MKNEAFYDIHCHAMNLSHPNLLAFISQLRFEQEGFGEVLFGPYSSLFMNRPFRKIRNMLSVMENDISNVFMIMEDDLAGRYLKSGGRPLLSDGILNVGGTGYSRIVLTPLLMDFEHRELSGGDIHYNRPPSKPVEEQIVDVVNGIHQYGKQRPDGRLEIYPFLGINTRNYPLKNLDELLQKYFGMYKPLKKLFRNVYSGLMSVSVQLPMIGAFHFAGIKLYPPLGFDPWPEDDGEELEKVRFLYGFCEKKGIPVTTHCSDSGFNVIDRKTAGAYTSPDRWVRALREFPALKINFAHMGMQYGRKFMVFRKQDWLSRILSFIRDYPNVYTDFSFIGALPDFYTYLAGMLEREIASGNGEIGSRILFGSDFLINLIEIDSYYEYVLRFSQTAAISPEIKHAFCSGNPERFVFG